MLAQERNAPESAYKFDPETSFEMTLLTAKRLSNNAERARTGEFLIAVPVFINLAENYKKITSSHDFVYF